MKDRSIIREKQYKQLLENLPKFPGLHGKDTYINSAVLIPFVMLDGQYHILFEKRAEGIMQGSEICFPGGIFDAKYDFDLADTAIRETIEETGIDADKISIDGLLDTFFTFRGVTIDPYVGTLQIESLDELSPDPAEVERLFTLPASFFIKNQPEIYHVRVEVQPSFTDEKGDEVVLLPVKDLGLPDRYAQPWGFVQNQIRVYKTPEDVIWGLTADLLFDLFRKLPTTGY